VRKSHIKRRGRKSLVGGVIPSILSRFIGTNPPPIVDVKHSNPVDSEPKKATDEEKRALIIEIDNHIRIIENKIKELSDIINIPLPQNKSESSHEFELIKGINTSKTTHNPYYSSTLKYFEKYKDELIDVLNIFLDIYDEVYKIYRDTISEDAKSIKDKYQITINSLDDIYPPTHEAVDVITLEQAQIFNRFIIRVYKETIRELQKLKLHIIVPNPEVMNRAIPLRAEAISQSDAIERAEARIEAAKKELALAEAELRELMINK
jgi:hypothetical protein